ncbi:unnamed protein product, partial [Callosobruchus maculatus]
MTMKTRKTNCADSQIAESPRHSECLFRRFLEYTPMIGNFGADCTDLTLIMHAAKNKKAV